MTNRYKNPIGPSGIAEWEERMRGNERTRPRAPMVIPDAANSDLIAQGQNAFYYYVPKAPILARGGSGEPIFKLILLLSRQPCPEDETIYSLIQHGRLNFDLTLEIPFKLLKELESSENVVYLPLFAREVIFDLIKIQDSQESIIASATASGSNARSALSVALDSSEAIAVLYALKGVSSKISIRVTVKYRALAEDRVVRIYGSWAAVHDFLSSRLGLDSEIHLREIRHHFNEMIELGVLSSTSFSHRGIEERLLERDNSLYLEMFMRLSSVILKRETFELDLGNPDNLYTLRGRPHPMFNIDFKQTVHSYEERFIKLSASLDEVIGGVLDDQNWDRFVDLGSGFSRAPRRIRTGPSFRGIDHLGEAGPISLAVLGGSIASLAVALRPDSTTIPSARNVLASEIIQTYKKDKAGVGHWAVDDVVVDRPYGMLSEAFHPVRMSFPVIEDSNASIWPDRINRNSFWYAPVFQVLQPAPSADASSSPFLFSFAVTGHDLSGRTGLNGTVRFMIEEKMSAATRVALEEINNPPADPVDLTSLSVSLALPFRDQTGATIVQLFPANLERSGRTVTATVDLIDDWVRLCYGALAFDNFQTEPVRLRLAYTYRAYVPFKQSDMILEYGGKIALTPVIFSAHQLREVHNRPFLNALEISYHQNQGIMRFNRESQDVLPATFLSRPPVISNDRKTAEDSDLTKPVRATFASETVSEIGNPYAKAASMSTSRPTVAAVAVKPVVAAANLAIRPELESSLKLQDLFKKQRYIIRSFGCDENFDLLYPCSTLGTFYIQLSNAGQTAIGCKDAFQLGQTTSRQYELVTDTNLAHSLYKVYRSLQQPRRFLVVPTAYRITRFAHTEGEKAFRPIILLYSIVDPADPDNNKCVVMVTLQPDLPPYVRRELMLKLSEYTKQPVVEYVTEIESQVAYTWSIMSEGELGIQPRAAKLWDSFQVSIATGISGAAQLQAILQTSGISANVVFELPDKSVVQTTLNMDLSSIVGPWTSGPVEISLKSGNASLHNRIELPVNVSDLIIYESNNLQRIRIDRLLNPGDTCSVAIPFPGIEAYAVYSIQPGNAATLHEIRSFVEDIHTNVVFINLVNYTNHNLKKLEIKACLKDVEGVYALSVTEDQPVAAVDFILPLTAYLANRILQFQVTKTSSSNKVSVTSWLEWPLDTGGNVISITWEMIK